MSETLRITILADNQAEEGLYAEHGLSLWIETGAEKILFDTGQGTALLHNAPKLGIDLNQTDIIVLSHGHYDHTGQIGYVLKRARNAIIYCHPAALQPRYSIRDGMAKPIHMSCESMMTLTNLSAQRLHWVSQPVWLSDRIGVTGFIPRKSGFEDVGGPFYIDTEAKCADQIIDDLALWIRTEKGLVVCVGCCHAGLVNTLSYLHQLHRSERVRAIIGGFHLLDAKDNRLEQTIKTVQSFAPELVIPCHCTGKKATEALVNALNQTISIGAAGQVYQFD